MYLNTIIIIHFAFHLFRSSKPFSFEIFQGLVDGILHYIIKLYYFFFNSSLFDKKLTSLKILTNFSGFYLMKKYAIVCSLSSACPAD